MSERRESTDKASRSGPSAKMIVAGIVAVLLIVLVVLNSQTVPLHLIFVTVEWPLWLLLTIVIVLALGIGYILGSQASKRRK
ncbi:MAG: LapA family protein [Acidimicrobiia bacterium]